MSKAPGVVPYEPRAQFAAFHRRHTRWGVLVCHRRAGKTVAAVNDLIARALYTKKPHARYAYLAPFHSQAKQIAWDYLVRYTQNIRRYMNVSELTVELINGSRIRLYGADNPDALRGIYLDGIVIDEPAQMKLRIWNEVILPALSDRKGWAVFIGTPAGRNAFYKIFKDAEGDPEWFSLLLKASESKILPDEELALLRKEMDEDAYRQEMECDFQAAVRGSYYGKLINQMGDRLRTGLYVPGVKVHAAFDLGIRDDSAVWFWQRIANETRYVGYDDASGLSVQEWIDKLNAQRWEYGRIWLPHDAKARSLQTGTSVVEQFHKLGVRAHLVPSMSLQNGIQATRRNLESCYIDTEGCERGLELLPLYQRLYDTKSQSFAEAPRHDYTSHCADGFRYSSIVAALPTHDVDSSAVPRTPGRIHITPASERTLNALWDVQPAAYARLYERIN